MRIEYVIAFIVAVLSIAAPSMSMEAVGEHPNVILIYSDDQGTLDAGCYGASDLATPHIDRLAETGVRFTQMYAPAPICSASRAGLLTGRVPARAGVPGNVSSQRGGRGLPPDEVTIAEVLRDAGYTTGHIGKWHLGYSRDTMPNAQGFDHSFGHMGGCIDNYAHFFYWVPPNQHDLWRNGEEIWETGRYFPDLMAEETITFIRQNKDRPFFIYLPFNVPHYPLQATQKWREHYQDVEPLPVRITHDVDPEQWKEYYKDQRSIRSMYAAFVSSMDERIGRVIDEVQRLGLRQKTLIIFQSDHGHSHESRTFWGGGYTGPFRGSKASLFEGGIRVPSVVSMPGTIPEGVVRDQMVVGCDWLPTIAEFCSAKLPERKLDGKSIAGVILRDEPSPHDHFYWSFSNQWVVRQGTWKLLANPRDPSNAAPLSKEDQERMLIDLSQDLGERNNVAGQHPEIVKRLTGIRDRYVRDIADENRSRPAAADEE